METNDLTYCETAGRFPRGRSGSPLVADLAALLERTLLAVERPPEVMNAEEAADFLRIPYQNFRRIAQGLPRHPVTERRYVYLRSELIEWLLSK